MLPFLRPDETPLRLSGATLNFSSCRNVTSVTQEIVDLVAPELIARATICERRPFGLYNGRTLNLIYALNETKKGVVTKSSHRTLSVSLNSDDEVMQAFGLQSFLNPFLLMVLSALFLVRNGRTPGKWLVGIQVTGRGCALCREARRLGVFVVGGAVSVALSVVPITSKLAHLPVLWFFLGGLAVFGLFVVLYIWPLIRWKGAMPYDRSTGFRVTRV
jgi:hypothetical protein